ncbi:MAG: hypothetical protein IH612_08665 [Desulfofustis sp.]|nr:hypothetical protein [Desulfofustis sp.]
MIALVIIGIGLVLLFLIEVVFGSSHEIYYAEIGCEADCRKTSTLSGKQFFLELLPFLACCSLGIYLLVSACSVSSL